MILFFDTETTGLPKNWKAQVTDLDNWPRLVQLAYLVYDFDGNLIHSCNEIVKPNGFVIPIDASKVHGITTDIAYQRGSKIEEVFELFSIHLKRAKIIVAHNMAYDEKIIGSELIRLGLDNILDSKEKICTMESTVDLCKIDGPYGYKWPKLEELHRFLFKHDFDGAHDAKADIQATAKCFWELVTRDVLFYKSINSSMIKDNQKSFDLPNNVGTHLRNIIELIEIAIRLNKDIKITYIDLNNVTSFRTIINVNFSLNVLERREVEKFKITNSHFTGFCTTKNEQRTFNIERVLDVQIVEDIDFFLHKNEFFIPVINLIGSSSWKLYSTTKQEFLKVFECFSDLINYCIKKDILKWIHILKSDLRIGKRTNKWLHWTVKSHFFAKGYYLDISKTDLFFGNKKMNQFKIILNHMDLSEEEGEIQRLTIREVCESIAILLLEFVILPEDEDEYPIHYERLICFVDKFGNFLVEAHELNFELKVHSLGLSSGNNAKIDPYFDIIEVGNQTWMLHNLNYENFRNGDIIPQATTDDEWMDAWKHGKPAWRFYENDPINEIRYGKIYNWFVVNDPRGIGPIGYSIPKIDDWIELLEFNENNSIPFTDSTFVNDILFGFDSSKSLFKARLGGGCDENGQFERLEQQYNPISNDLDYHFSNSLNHDSFWWADSNSNLKVFKALNVTENSGFLVDVNVGKGCYLRLIKNR